MNNKKLTISGRDFHVSFNRLLNGGFISITEGSEPRFGAIVLALKSIGRVNSSVIIPEKHSSIISIMLAELLAKELDGIALLSIFLKDEVDSQVAKVLFSEIRNLI